MLETTGIVSNEKIKEKINNLRLSNNQYGAVIECYQEIPCNPCSTSCPFDAILITPDINAIPKIDYTKCTGCGICVYNCPGLAIFVSNLNYSDNEALFKISYELLPLPKVGDIVKGINRNGEIICDVEVIRVQNAKTQNHTALIHVLIPKKDIENFITIKVGV